MNSPDLVRRAAARLGNVALPRDARDTQPKPALSSASGAALDELPRPAPAPAAPMPAGKTVNISPTSLAANGISLPSAGYGRTIEEFRIVKRQIMANSTQALVSGGSAINRVIMITSAKPGDGKTFTAINLALALAVERDVKVLLVDADVYRQSMMDYLGIKAQAGWIDLLTDNEVTFGEVLLHTNIPNLTVLPAGKAHNHVPELMSSRKMTRFVAEMAERYPDRYIIFDTLPCLVSSEPAILAGLSGQALFVVAAQATSRNEVESSLRLINACPSVSLVLNKTEPLLAEQFGKYGYGYEYER